MILFIQLLVPTAYIVYSNIHDGVEGREKIFL